VSKVTGAAFHGTPLGPDLAPVPEEIDAPDAARQRLVGGVRLGVVLPGTIVHNGGDRQVLETTVSTRLRVTNSILTGVRR
jgi:hypothetical protein